MDYSDYILDLGEHVRDLYIRERRSFSSIKGKYISGKGYLPGPQWDGGKNSAGHNRTPIWPKIALFIAEKKLDPLKFIRASFEYASRYPPEPNFLLSDTALKRYYMLCETGGKLDLATAAQLQKELLKANLYKYIGMQDWTQEEVLATVLLDETVEMGPLFRYSMASKFKLPTIQNEYFNAAVFEYMRDQDAYDAQWADIIPSDFSKTATAYYSKVIKNG